jgi:hypothetical protein
MRLWVVAAVVGIYALLSAYPAHAERESFTDSQGQLIERDGEITCVYFNATRGACGRTLPLERGQAWHMRPTHDCSRPSATDLWSCQPRAGGGLTPEQQQALLLMLMNRGQPRANPGLGFGQGVLRSLCLNSGGTFDPATATCYTPPPRPPVRCHTRSMGGGNWETICD